MPFRNEENHGGQLVGLFQGDDSNPPARPAHARAGREWFRFGRAPCALITSRHAGLFSQAGYSSDGYRVCRGWASGEGSEYTGWRLYTPSLRATSVPWISHCCRMKSRGFPNTFRTAWPHSSPRFVCDAAVRSRRFSAGSMTSGPISGRHGSRSRNTCRDIVGRPRGHGSQSH